MDLITYCWICFGVLVAHMKSVLGSSLRFWSVQSGFISVLAEAPVHDGPCEVCRSLLWLRVEPALWACGGLASICRCVVYWHCDDVVRETRLSEVYLHLDFLFLPPAVHHKTSPGFRFQAPRLADLRQQRKPREQTSVSTSGPARPADAQIM